MRLLYALFLLLPFITPAIKTFDTKNTTEINPIMSSTCPCPHTCNNVWRGNNICDMECDILECNWDDGDCRGFDQFGGQCIGNITIENIKTGNELDGYCFSGAKGSTNKSMQF